MPKVAYKRVEDLINPNCVRYVPLELLPLCKEVIKRDRSYHYRRARRKFLGLVPYKVWVNKGDIVWHNPDKIHYYYECDIEGVDDEEV